MFTIPYQNHLYFFSSSHPTSDSAAVCQQERYYTSTTLPVCRSPIQSQPCGLVLRAFPSQLIVRPSSEIPLPILSSTPIDSKTASNHHNNTSKATKTVLTVQYPSKTINKPLNGSYQTIGKALAHGVPSQIANAIMKNPKSLKRHAKSGKHSEPCKEKDLHELIKRAEEMNVFEEKAGRSYNHFCNFKRDRFEELDSSKFYYWINDHKKKLHRGIRAR